MFFQKFIPDRYYSQLKFVPFQDFYKQGKRLIFLDMDNTLVPHGSFEATDEAKLWVATWEKMGFNLVVLSNAKSNRSKSLASTLGLAFLSPAKKPSPSVINVYLESQNYSKTECIMLGDQIFTDVLAGNLANIYTVLIDPIDKKEPWWILIKRFFEKGIKYFMVCEK